MTGNAYNVGSGSGGTAGGSGQTTPLRLSASGLTQTDKKVLCKAICVCSRQPDIGKAGADLKQQCVSRNLRDLDKASGWKSPYKGEVNYNMAKDPPEPIMRSATPLEPHGFLPAWIEKYWEGGRDAYPAGTGAVRRPDVVIVKDPTLPPTQDNLRSVVEIKFPPQTVDRDQQAADERIAGAPEKATVLGPDNCDCSQDDEDENPVKSAVSDALSELGRSLRALSRSSARLGPGGLPPTMTSPGAYGF
ncbi:VRR-NUC domain-containing protein [Burkholderia glumae]|uniref:VRR-NUC domain-containing protein n=1 Tax=Burkholderia glumae TaxID=337 RepID=UPI00129620FE|nr:VRR-NUC domain-containing protein [Burkholderia glumae]QGA36718.1 VRR-NUC domain-containing protein [Burkholderia glumae]